MSSNAYSELGGTSGPRRWPRAYTEAIAKPCPRCHAKPLQLCTNPVTPWKQHQAKVPCLVRITALRTAHAA